MKELIEKTYSYKGMDVYYYVTGNLEGEAIVLLHPAFGDHKIFKEQFEYFQEKYYLIAIDMIGHGNSQLDSSKANLGDMPEIIKGILLENEISKAHLVGVSLGSIIAQGVAEQCPSFVSTVTIVGGYSIHKDNKEILKAQRKEMFKWLFYIVFSMKKFRNYVANVSVYSEEGKKVFREGMDKFKRKSFIGMQGTDKFFIAKDEPVDYPLFIVCGEHDIEIAKRAGKGLEILEPKAHYIEIKDAGHCANIDNAPCFNRLLEEFIESKAEQATI